MKYTCGRAACDYNVWIQSQRLRTLGLVQGAAACYLIAQAPAATRHFSPVKPLLCSLSASFTVSVFTFSMFCDLDKEYVKHPVEIALDSSFLCISYRLLTTRVRLVSTFLITDPGLYHLVHHWRILNLLPCR